MYCIFGGHKYIQCKNEYVNEKITRGKDFKEDYYVLGQINGLWYVRYETKEVYLLHYWVEPKQKEPYPEMCEYFKQK